MHLYLANATFTPQRTRSLLSLALLSVVFRQVPHSVRSVAVAAECLVEDKRVNATRKTNKSTTRLPQKNTARLLNETSLARRGKKGENRIEPGYLHTAS